MLQPSRSTAVLSNLDGRGLSSGGKSQRDYIGSQQAGYYGQPVPSGKSSYSRLNPI